MTTPENIAGEELKKNEPVYRGADGKIYSATPANEWEQNLRKDFDLWYREQAEMNPYIMRDYFIAKTKTLLDQHSTHLVERYEQKIKDLDAEWKERYAKMLSGVHTQGFKPVERI
jgi:activator of HSP90 ATPase